MQEFADAVNHRFSEQVSQAELLKEKQPGKETTSSSTGRTRSLSFSLASPTSWLTRPRGGITTHQVLCMWSYYWPQQVKARCEKHLNT